MAQAKRKSTTNTSIKRSPPPPPSGNVDPARLPPKYALRLRGDCMQPLIADNAVIEVSSTQAVKPGDIAVFWFRPECLKPGDTPCSLKRVVLAPPSYVKFPWKEHPDSTVHALVIVEMLNPPRQLHYRCADILAMHKFVRIADARQVLTPADQALVA
jgi:hypothetical protein